MCPRDLEFAEHKDDFQGLTVKNPEVALSRSSVESQPVPRQQEVSIWEASSMWWTSSA